MTFQEFKTTVNNAEMKTKWEVGYLKNIRVLEKNQLYISDEYDTNRKVLPYDEYAVNSICNRADVSGGAIHRVSKELFRAHLNEYFKVANKRETIINVYDGKIYACHSQNYRILNIKHLSEVFVDYILDNYPNAEIVSCVVTPIVTYCDVALNNEALNKKYSDALSTKIGYSTSVYPVLRFITSNTGWSGANLIPLIYISKSIVITSHPIILKHEGKANIDKFAENCDKAFSLMLEGAEKLEDLANIDIDYPVNCAANVAQEIKLPKKMTLEILYKMEEDFGYASATAKDVYLYLSKIIALYDDPIKKFKMADQLSRALTLDFKKFDRVSATWLKDSSENDRNLYYGSFSA